ncbi:pyrroloquinoline quinone biosynthesis protein PqqE [Paracoccus saliphilus]|uniref:PqqA peptide cyclase n=1 Tax=Paracoccus saliphilus TaxID=405559 RepID=A0AA46A3Y2_9RHOB|nr:pyrroloquinoline quinone biosynthesis protein PqqE [Paracoccus saliphilus]WCR03369.1 pyrroloquinoline quinone biosynthesis protein PqqE [Paracoccus saliphilus]SIS52346.1 pyrroloquinoline quinone biosynthesis protein E [Paracoccus saliphilus]
MKDLPAQPRDLDGNPVTPGLPMAMLAEITHRCPLACPYCSNPVELTRSQAELPAEDWARVFREAADLGVLQVHISGGEPGARRDLAQIVESASAAGLYVNLITSGIGITRQRLEELDSAGVDHVQLSLQGIRPDMADRISGHPGSWDKKMGFSEWVTEIGFPLTINAVVHRQNMERLPDMIELAESLGARRIEVATVQFHGWADLNRKALMPTREQAAFARQVVNDARVRLRGRLVIDYVPADHHAVYPKACMGGWGSTGLNVAPDGSVLPCHAANSIDWLQFENVRDRSLSDIWHLSDAFNAFRGTEWMAEPCRSCERKNMDFGGCRCQAMAIAGDARATDPVCSKSPLHAQVVARAEEDADADTAELIYRRMKKGG